MKKLLPLLLLVSFTSCICLKKQHKPGYYQGEYQVVLYNDTVWIYNGFRLVRRFVDTVDNEYRETFIRDNTKLDRVPGSYVGFTINSKCMQ